jgi:hypothetical protein
MSKYMKKNPKKNVPRTKMTVVSWRAALFSAAMISGVLAAGLGASCFLAATATGASFLAATGLAIYT